MMALMLMCATSDQCLCSPPGARRRRPGQRPQRRGAEAERLGAALREVRGVLAQQRAESSAASAQGAVVAALMAARASGAIPGIHGRLGAGLARPGHRQSFGSVVGTGKGLWQPVFLAG